MNTNTSKYSFIIGCAIYAMNVMATQKPVDVTSIPTDSLIHSLNYNAAFERTFADGYGFSGGDHITSFELPFCDTCLPDKQHRRLWLFGDTLVSHVGSDALRYKTQPPTGSLGTDYVFGNTVAVTYHPNNSAPDSSEIVFDWGHAGGSLQDQAWIGFSLDTQSLPDMHSLRIKMHGYQSMEFGTPVKKNFRVFASPAISSLEISSDRVPIYEYYSAFVKGNTFSRNYLPAGGFSFEYRRIAFYILPSPIPGETLPLYRFYSNFLKDSFLTTEPDLGGFLGYENPILLGYVYKDEHAPDSATSLWEYFRFEPTQSNGHHKYTTQRNDLGVSTDTILNWPMNGVAIDNDLVVSFAPVHISSGIFSPLEHRIFSIVRNAHRPYHDWGKTLQGTWSSNPPQYVEGGHSDIAWGKNFIKDDNFVSNRVVYILGSRHTNDVPGATINSPRLYLARVVANTADDVVNYSLWEFFDGTEWSSHEKDAKPLLIFEYDENGDVVREIGFVANTVTPARGPGGNWIFAQTDSTSLSETIGVISAPALTGPWRLTAKLNLRNLLPHEQDVPPGQLTYYAVNTQPNLSLNGSQDGVLISYVRSVSCWLYVNVPESQKPFSCQTANSQSPDNLSLKANVYTPRFIDVPWSELFPEQ